MTRELFVESINALQAQYEHDKKCGDAFQMILPDTHTGLYDNHFVNNQLLKLLQVLTNDYRKHSWIEYFCFELDFGRLQTKDFHAWRDDGSHIDLGNAEKLWEFLQELNIDHDAQVSDTTEAK